MCGLEIDRTVGLDAFHLLVGARCGVPVIAGEGCAHFRNELFAQFDLFFLGHDSNRNFHRHCKNLQRNQQGLSRSISARNT